jgi:predicted ATPase
MDTPTPDQSRSSDHDELSVNTIRTLTIDAVQKANSGHPGTYLCNNFVVDFVVVLLLINAHGSVALVLLSGEAGIGKSRLTRGMIEAVSSEAHIRVSNQCSPYHSDSPLYPIIQQLAFAAGIRSDDDNDDKLDRLEKVLVGAEGDRPLFAALLGLQTERRYGTLSLTPQQQRARTLQALVDQLVGLSRGKPVLFVLEDAHWIDATTLELVDFCLDQVASARVMMLVTTRPTFQHGFGGHPVVTKLALNRLGRDQITSIVNRLTNGKTLPGRIDDCACMSLFTIDTMEKADDGKNPQLAFAVYHLVEMVLDLKRHYHAAYNGEIEP